MSNSNTFRNHLFKIHLNPAPRTQSESNAVLRALQNFGPVSLFQIIPNNGEREQNYTETCKNGSGVPDRAIVANLAFSRNTKAVEGLREGTGRRRFTVTANANIPDVSVRDPFNVRGLKSRKPELAPRDIKCRIVAASSSSSSPRRGGTWKGEYSDTFAVDRDSVFAEILTKTDCPSGIISGLLPKLSDEHRAVVASNNSNSRHDTVLQRLDLDALEGRMERESAITLARGWKSVPGFGQKKASKDASVQFHDEFASLRDVSLMQMYREAAEKNNGTKGDR